MCGPGYGPPFPATKLPQPGIVSTIPSSRSTAMAFRTVPSVRQALQRLAARGYEFRVPMGAGRDGRLVFAAKGHSLDFIVPAMPERRLPAGTFTKATVMDGKATPADAKGDSGQSPLSSAPPLTTSPQKQASRRAHASSASDDWTINRVVRDVREAVAQVHGQREADELSDGEALGLFYTYVKNRRPPHLVAYLVKILGDAPYLDTYLANVEPACTSCAQWESNCACPAAA